MSKSRVLIAAAAVGLAAVASAAWLLLPPTPKPTVVLVVLDAVRADHLSVCGYERETSPVLQDLVDQGAQLSCGGVAPGSWTLPSHASYFTGVMPMEHRAHSISSGITDYSGSGSRARPLDGQLSTLAERFTAMEYETLLLSANPVVGQDMGLARGFGTVDTADRFGRYFGKHWAKTVNLAVTHRQVELPQFMVFNIADAHQPWGPPSRDAPWDSAGKAVSYNKRRDDGPWAQYLTGQMDPMRRAPYLQHSVDAYDWAVHTADQNLGVLLETIEQEGFCERAGCRVVITSDHGELLGEHGLLDHGHYVYQANARVPVLIMNIAMGDEPLPELPELLSALVVHDLALTGQLPEPMPAVELVAWPHARRCGHLQGQAFCNVQVATWSPDGDKRIWDEGDSYLVNLSADPLEQSLVPAEPSERLSQLAKRAKQEERDDSQVDGNVVEMLRAAGYLD